jgi:hypothetical protein
MVFREKAMALRHRGNLDEGYRPGGKPVFQPTLATRATSGALDAAARLGDSIEREVARFGTDRRPPVVEATGRGCEFPWHAYCQAVATAVDYAIGQGRRVLFVTQPYLNGDHARARHVWQQRAVAAMLRERYGKRAGFQYVDLGDAVDLRDPILAFDGMHLTPEGNARIADRLVQPMLKAATSHGEPPA